MSDMGFGRRPSPYRSRIPGLGFNGRVPGLATFWLPSRRRFRAERLMCVQMEQLPT
jgi:hypothetical protein